MPRIALSIPSLPPPLPLPPNMHGATASSFVKKEYGQKSGYELYIYRCFTVHQRQRLHSSRTHALRRHLPFLPWPLQAYNTVGRLKKECVRNREYGYKLSTENVKVGFGAHVLQGTPPPGRGEATHLTVDIERCTAALPSFLAIIADHILFFVAPRVNIMSSAAVSR